MEAIAKTKYLKGSPRKARLVIDLIRGRNVSQSLAILKFTDKRAAEPIEKCLRSAIANATFLAEKQNIAIDPDDLFVKSCFVDMGPHKNRRRMRPAPQGRAYREQRHYCHITIEVSSDNPQIEEKKNLALKEKTGGEKTAKSSSKSSTTPKAPKPSKKAPGEIEVDETNKATNADTPVEETVSTSAAPEETTSSKATESSKAVTEESEKADAQAADAKDAESQREKERHETKPADQKMLDTNEQLERQ